MSSVAKTNTFVAGTYAEAAKVNQNFDDLVNYTNDEVIVRDGSKAFTAVPSGPATNPTSDNQFTRKKYVDDQDASVTASVTSLSGTVTSNKTAADNAFLKRPQVADDNRMIRAADFVDTTDANGRLTVTFKNAAGTNTPFPNGVATVVACSGDFTPTGTPVVVAIESKSASGFVCKIWKVNSVSAFGATVLDPYVSASARVSYFAFGY